MQEHLNLLQILISIHGHKAKLSKNKLVYLIEKDDLMNPNSPLVAFKEENLLSNFSHDSLHFRWLMKQFKTYDYEKQVVIGLIINKETILSEVLGKIK